MSIPDRYYRIVMTNDLEMSLSLQKGKFVVCVFESIIADSVTLKWGIPDHSEFSGQGS
jgi:repressor of nif and glnA expression